MNKKNISHFFISLLIILLVIIILLIICLKNKMTNEVQNNMGSSIAQEYAKTKNNSISQNSYFDINSCVTEYLQILNTKRSIYYQRNENGEFVIAVEENEIKKNIYNVLSKNYIEKNNITIENVYEYVKTLEEQAIFVPLEASVVQDEEIKSFLVHGLVEKLNYNVIDEIFLVVNIDIANKLFSIEPIYGNYNNIAEIKIDQKEKEIKNNTINTFKMYSINYETTVKDCINLYKRLAFGKPEIMYNLLDEEYRNAKFGSVDEFKKFVEANRKKINSIRIERYKVTNTDDYTQYLCVDKDDNYYIFRKKGVLDYTVILDSYTVDLPEFLEKYKTSADNLKVALNLERIRSALKDGDYSYVYNKLDNNFKLSNFKTVNDFEKYIKERFAPLEDIIKYDNYKIAAGLHVYDIEVTDKSENKIIKAQAVMQLKEGTDFVMSFSTNN